MSARKIWDQHEGTTIDHYEPEIVTLDDYYPYGEIMPGRSFANTTLGGPNYRFGFNGKEKDGNISALTHYDYGFRIYNPSIARFLSVDPLTDEYPELTPYQFASNRPIDGIDLDGLEWCSFDLDINDPNVRRWAKQEGVYNYRDSKTYQSFNSARGEIIDPALTFINTVFTAGFGTQGFQLLPKYAQRGIMGDLVNTSYEKVINKSDAQTIAKSAVAGFLGGAANFASINHYLAGGLSSFMEEIASQIMNNLDGTASEFSKEDLIIKTVIGVGSAGLAEALGNAIGSKIDETFKKKVKEFEDNYNKTYKEINEKTGLSMKETNKILAKKKAEIGKQYQSLKQVIKTAVDRMIDYGSNAAKG